jgi:hypothetical protein
LCLRPKSDLTPCVFRAAVVVFVLFLCIVAKRRHYAPSAVG